MEKSISNKLTVLIVLVLALVIIQAITLTWMGQVMVSLNDVASRVDLVTSAVEQTTRSMTSGINEIFNLMTEMRVY